MSLLSYEEQIYLLHYWLRTNIPATAQVGSIAALTTLIAEELEKEYAIHDSQAIDDLIACFQEMSPWDTWPDT